MYIYSSILLLIWCFSSPSRQCLGCAHRKIMRRPTESGGVAMMHCAKLNANCLQKKLGVRDVGVNVVECHKIVGSRLSKLSA